MTTRQTKDVKTGFSFTEVPHNLKKGTSGVQSSEKLKLTRLTRFENFSIK